MILSIDEKSVLAPTRACALCDAAGNSFSTAVHLYLYLKYMFAAFPHARAARLAKEFTAGGAFGEAWRAEELRRGDGVPCTGLEVDKGMWDRMRLSAAGMALQYRFAQDGAFCAALLASAPHYLVCGDRNTFGNALMQLRDRKR